MGYNIASFEDDSENQCSKSIQWSPSNTDTLGPLKCVLIREVSSFHFRGKIIHIYMKLGAWSSVLIREVSSFQGCLCFRGALVSGEPFKRGSTLYQALKH